MTDAPDFPAAHSMDTSWFAIDNDGNVAIFDSGEAGCVPEAAYLSEPWDLEEALRALPVSGFKFDPAGMNASQHAEHVIGDLPENGQLYMFLSELVPVSDLLARLDAEEIGATTCRAVRLTARDPAALAELHARGACTSCYRNWGNRTPTDQVAAHGVYQYKHTCENWISGPYARTAVPVNPLAIDQIPQSVRDAAIAYDGKFSETQQLQPAELWPCKSSESGWLASDGETARPFNSENLDLLEDTQGDDGIKWVADPYELPPAKPKWWK